MEEIQDPGKLGTIIRTASWFEAAAIVAGTGTADPYHPKTVRSTAGATGATPLVTGDLAEILSFYSARGWDVILLDSANDSIPLRETVKKERQIRSEEHTSELQSRGHLVCRLLLEKKKR